MPMIGENNKKVTQPAYKKERSKKKKNLLSLSFSRFRCSFLVVPAYIRDQRLSGGGGVEIALEACPPAGGEGGAENENQREE